MKLSKLFMLLLGVAVLLAVVPQVMAQSKAERQEEKKGNSGKKHEGAKSETGPLVHTFIVKQDVNGLNGKPFGTANVTLNPDGTWNYSGDVGKDLNWALSGCEFNVVIGVKSAEGTVIAFRHTAALEKEKPGSYSWQKQGKNATIKDNFKAFAKDHDWYGSWNCVGLPQPGSSSNGGGGGPGAGAVISDVVGVLGTILAFF
jgi:hypothetical protein